MSKIYLVERETLVGYDEFSGFVVVAKSAGQARNMCAEKAADEGKETWLKTATSTVIGYPRDDTPRIILESFHAG